MNTKKLLSSVLAACAIGLCAAPAQATLMLTLNDGAGHTRTIVDGGAGDMNSAAGVIFFFGSVGTWIGDWTITTGVSNSPGDSVAILGLNVSNLVSRGAGNMTITLTDNGFTSPSGPGLGAITQVGGVAGGNISFTSLLNGSSVSSFGTGAGSFSGTNGAGVDTTGGFSLTQTAVITHTGAGNSSFNIITTVPEPATLGLLGLRLLGLGFIRRNRKA